MLNIFRESVKSWGIRVLIYFVALTFVGSAFLVWELGGTGKDGIVAIVGDIQITREHYSDQVRQVENSFRSQFGAQVDSEIIKALNAPAIAMGALVESALQLRQAQKAGLTIIDAEVRDYITQMPEFQSGGMFSARNYRSTLARNGLTAKNFEDNLKNDLLALKLRAIVESTVNVSDAEVVDLYLDRTQPVVVEYVVFRQKDYLSKVEADESKIGEWFENTKGRFANPEERAFSMLVATPESMADSVKIDDQYLQTYFDEHAAEYETEEQVKASHILAQVSLTASDKEVAAAKSKVEKALEKIKAGVDFAVVAKEMSEGPSAQAGGDLGSFPRAQMVKEFEDVAFGLEPGNVSEPFRTEFGWHIVKTFSRSPGGSPTFEEVKDKIEGKARQARAWEMARSLIGNLSDSPAPGQFDDGAKSHEGVKVERYKTVQGMPIAGLVEWRVVSDVAFGLEQGAVSQPVELSSGFAVLKLDSITPSATPPLDQIKNKVKKAYVKEQSLEMARAKADEMAKLINDGKSIKEVANAGGHKVTVTMPYSKASLDDPKTKADEGMLRQAFALEVGAAGVAPIRGGGGGAIVFMLSSRESIDPEVMRAGLPTFRKSLYSARKERVYTSYIVALRKQAEQSGEIEILIDIGQAIN